MGNWLIAKEGARGKLANKESLFAVLVCLLSSLVTTI